MSKKFGSIANVFISLSISLSPALTYAQTQENKKEDIKPQRSVAVSSASAAMFLSVLGVLGYNHVPVLAFVRKGGKVVWHSKKYLGAAAAATVVLEAATDYPSYLINHASQNLIKPATKAISSGLVDLPFEALREGWNIFIFVGKHILTPAQRIGAASLELAYAIPSSFMEGLEEASKDNGISVSTGAAIQVGTVMSTLILFMGMESHFRGESHPSQVVVSFEGEPDLIAQLNSDETEAVVPEPLPDNGHGERQ
jgi:ribosome-associated toxin RatA of RatAB toxin-antitoxin module